MSDRDEPFDRGDVELIAAQIPTFEIAQLLRAAPDLYAACKAAHDFFVRTHRHGQLSHEDECEICHGLGPTLHTAIAHAEGIEE